MWLCFQVSPERGMPPPSSPGGSAFHYFEGGLHLSAESVDLAAAGRFPGTLVVWGLRLLSCLLGLRLLEATYFLFSIKLLKT